MPDYVRVKHADPKLRIIDAPAVDVNGRPLPPKPHQTLAEAVDKPKPAQKESK